MVRCYDRLLDLYRRVNIGKASPLFDFTADDDTLISIYGQLQLFGRFWLGTLLTYVCSVPDESTTLILTVLKRKIGVLKISITIDMYD